MKQQKGRKATKMGKNRAEEPTERHTKKQNGRKKETRQKKSETNKICEAKNDQELGVFSGAILYKKLDCQVDVKRLFSSDALATSLL